MIISRTASKIHGIAGLRVGFAIARPDIIERLRPTPPGPQMLRLACSDASLQDTEYQTFVKAKNREGQRLLMSALKGMGKRVATSQANFVFFQTGVPVETFSRHAGEGLHGGTRVPAVQRLGAREHRHAGRDEGVRGGAARGVAHLGRLNGCSHTDRLRGAARSRREWSVFS